MRDTRFCEVYLNNRRYVYDDGRKVFCGASREGPRAVTMEAVRVGEVHAALAPYYVIAGVPYYYDEGRDELAQVFSPGQRLRAQEFTALIHMGAVTAPVGEEFRAIMRRASLEAMERER